MKLVINWLLYCSDNCADEFDSTVEVSELSMKERGIVLWLVGNRVVVLRRWMFDE